MLTLERLVKQLAGLKSAIYGIRPVRILRRCTPAVMLSPAVAMPAGVHCQRPPAGRIICMTRRVDW